jgi:putative acetyltransferase
MDTRYGLLTITDIDPDQAAHLLSDATAMYHRLYPENSNHFVFAAELRAEGSLFLGAHIKDTVVGCVGLVAGSEETVGEVKRFYVDPEYRQAGIGNALMDSLEQISRARGLRTFQLETGSADFDAHTLYHSRGYHVIGPFGTYKEDPFSVFYERDLLG